MGYDQNNAGIHLVPIRKAFEGINHYGKYSEMILSEKANQDKKLIEDVETCNFCQITFEKGKTKKCRCGGRYTYHSKLPLKFHKNNQMRTIFVVGMICKECGRKLFLRYMVLKEIYKDLKEN